MQYRLAAMGTGILELDEVRSMKKRNWHFIVLWTVVIILSIFIPGMISNVCHSLAVRISKQKETEDEKQNKAGTETQRRQTEMLSAETQSNIATEQNEGSSISETETVTEEKRESIYHEKEKGYAKQFLGDGERSAVFQNTAELYLEGITGETCRLTSVTFLEPYGKDGYRTELTYQTEDGYSYQEELICEYDSEYQFYRIYPEGMEEDS